MKFEDMEKDILSERVAKKMTEKGIMKEINSADYEKSVSENLEESVRELGRSIKAAVGNNLPCAVGETVYTIKNGIVEHTYFDTEEEIMKVAKAFGVRLFLDESAAINKLLEMKGTTNNEGESTMGLLERGYKAAATADLERSLRELEERDRTAMQKTDLSEETTAIRNNLNFAERLNLISATQAEQYRQRIEFLRELQQKQTEEIVDSLENPRERAARYQSLDSYNARIAQERTSDNAENGTRANRVVSHEETERAH